MTQIIREITVDVVQTNTLRAITAKQNDLNSRFLKIHITNEGAPIIVDPSSIVSMNVKRTDNSGRMFYGTVNSDGSVTVPLTPWMLALSGSINCDVSIIRPEDNHKLTTMQFSIYVEAAVLPLNDIEDFEEHDILVDLLKAAENAEECAKATEDAVEAAERANKAADGVVITEQNSQTRLTFWVGTQAEYGALESVDPGCFYIISDDPTLNEIYAKIATVANTVTNMQTPYDISQAVVPRHSVDTYKLTRIGKTLTLTYNFNRSTPGSKETLATEVPLVTIQGYAPVQDYYIYAYTSDTPDGTNAAATSRPMLVKADDSGKNTQIYLLKPYTSDTSSESNVISLTVTFAYK